MAASKSVALSGSILDTDLYKLTMQAAVMYHYPNVQVSYKFHNRTQGSKFSQYSIDWIRGEIDGLSSQKISMDELMFLRRRCPYFSDTYLDFLRDFRFRPAKEITLKHDATTLSFQLEIHGLWMNVIMYEVKLLAIISEAYFKFEDTAWNHDMQSSKASEKAARLISSGINFSEFGTRRRRDYLTQDLVLQAMISEQHSVVGKGKLLGTSNVHFAHRYDLQPIGTVAHEWFMGIAAIEDDYVNANAIALQKWKQLYRNELSIALTDTFGTEIFLRNFTPALANDCAGVRQDSGNPKAFTNKIVQFYKSLGIDPRFKTIVFSDGLDVECCLELDRHCKESGIQASFGIGTFLTNDFENSKIGGKSKALNIVIKLSEAASKPTLKISDTISKHTGTPQLLASVQQALQRAGVELPSTGS